MLVICRIMQCLDGIRVCFSEVHRLTDWALWLMAAAVGSCGNWCWFETKCSLAIISTKERARQSLHPIIPSSEVACQAQLLPYQTHVRLDTWPTHTHSHIQMYVYTQDDIEHSQCHSQAEVQTIFTNICVKTYTMENVINVRVSYRRNPPGEQHTYENCKRHWIGKMS